MSEVGEIAGTASAVTPEHIFGFGAVIHRYAAVEMQIRHLIGAMIDIPVVDLHILATEYSSRQIKQVATSLIRSRDIITDQGQELLRLIDVFWKFSALRNHIAHGWWIAGKRPHSIKPMHLKLTDKSPRTTGVIDGERDYLAGELIRAADEMAALYGEFQKLLVAQPWGRKAID